MTQQSAIQVNNLPFSLGITVMPEWFQHEGVEAVLDRVQGIGATAIATSPYLLERVADGQGGREPPPDGEAGKVRPLDRELFGARELWVRTAPCFEHDVKRYVGLRYQPAPPTALTRANPDLIDRVLAAAKVRGMQVFLQVMAASPPAYRVQFSRAVDEDQSLTPEGVRHDARVDKNACLASPHIQSYVQALLKELAERYSGVTGFRLDWPEYPPYDALSALFDFNPAMFGAIRKTGHDPEEVRSAAISWMQSAREAATSSSTSGVASVVRALTPMWHELLQPKTALRALFAAKQQVSLDLLAGCRKSLDAGPASRMRLEPQIMPPPLNAISGFPLSRLHGIADAVGVKLYTMHWPMIARYWARDLVGSTEGAQADVVSCAIAQLFGFVDSAPSIPSNFRYPLPDQAHPVSKTAQIDKIEATKRIAGRTPVIAFAHAYGPLADVLDRFSTAKSGADAVWVNRYGYLSDEKLAAIRTVSRA